MARPRRPRICTACGQPETADRPLSTRFMHTDCGVQRMAESSRHINARQGWGYEKWVAGLAAAAEKHQRQLQSQ